MPLTTTPTPTPTSPRRREASRRNGALSHGPITPEGKARSSRNAVTHGCLAALITFNPEDAAAFDCIHAEYIARFEPRDQAEHDLVEEIVRAKWQLRQAWAYESSIIGMQMVQDSTDVDRRWKSLPDHDRRALAFSAAVKENNTLNNLQRYARSLALQAERAMNLLFRLKEQPLPPAQDPDQDTGPEPVESTERNDPNPISEQPAGVSESPVLAPEIAIDRAIHAYAFTPPRPRIPNVSTPLRAAAAGAPLQTGY